MGRHQLQPPPQAGDADGKTINPRDPSGLLNPCASFQSRSAKVHHDLSFVFLSSATPKPFDTQTISKAPTLHCPAIDRRRFYKAFNTLVLGPYVHGAHNHKKEISPLLFDPTGKAHAIKFIKRKDKHTMPSSCKDIRAALAACLQSSDCIMIQRHTPAECLRPPLLETMPTKCQQLKKGYGECKRGMVDMRKRFRGNQPIAVSKELDGGAQEPSHQLYAGKPAFAGTVKVTEGREPEERDWRELENERFRKESGNS